jgi:hypothetical protein
MSEPTPDPPPKRKIRISISRQRLVELTVVVFGVLIALGLENLIQEARYRADARDLERAFVSDLRSAVSLSLERQAIRPCLIDRVRVLSDRVSAETGDWTAADVVDQRSDICGTPQIYRSPSRVWVTSSFDRALGSEAFKRIPAERASQYASIFAQIESVSDRNASEYFAVSGLAPLGYRQSSVTTEVRADLLQQIANLDRHQALIGIATDQIITNILSFEQVGDDLRRGAAENPDAFERFKATIRTAYGDCADLTVFDRLNNSAAS